jgi:hypothetical protein
MGRRKGKVSPSRRGSVEARSVNMEAVEEGASRFIGAFYQDFGRTEVERRAPARFGPGKVHDRDLGADERCFEDGLGAHRHHRRVEQRFGERIRRRQKVTRKRAIKNYE